jgi:hypothetical protein
MRPNGGWGRGNRLGEKDIALKTRDALIVSVPAFSLMTNELHTEKLHVLMERGKWINYI